jgi:hypothetical protein
VTRVVSNSLLHPAGMVIKMDAPLHPRFNQLFIPNLLKFHPGAYFSKEIEFMEYNWQNQKWRGFLPHHDYWI